MEGTAEKAVGNLGRILERCLLLGDQQGPVRIGEQDYYGKPGSFLVSFSVNSCHL